MREREKERGNKERKDRSQSQLFVDTRTLGRPYGKKKEFQKLIVDVR